MTSADLIVLPSGPPAIGPLSPADQAALARAVEALERTSFAVTVSNALGKQVEMAGRFVPERISGIVSKAATAALRQAMRIAIRSLVKRPIRHGQMFHRALAAASGIAGGAFGLAALPIELPVSTTIMLRAIADVARTEGENLDDPEAVLACLQVFALSGRSPSPDVLEGGYFVLRGFLAKSISEAARYMAHKSVIDETAPILIRLTSQIAARFGVVVSQKLAAQAVPFLGAAGGAAVNVAFTEHFQSLAKGHFTVRRLERTYGTDLVRAEYEKLRRSVPAS